MAARLLLGGLFLSGLALAGCASEETGPRIVCPNAVLVPDADRLVRFQGAGRDLTDVDFQAELEEPLIACGYDDDSNAIEADLRLRFIAERGPADQDRQGSFRYFVAIATLANNQVVAREEFGLSVPFEGNRNRVGIVEDLSPRIPLRGPQSGAEYRVYVGFSLTPQEMAYNRESR